MRRYLRALGVILLLAAAGHAWAEADPAFPGKDIRYEMLFKDSKAEALQRILTNTIRAGLPGEHHFYIDFNTKAAGVTIPQDLLEKYPETMTIVLQYQFENLEVTDSGFGVDLFFSERRVRLQIPFAAVTAFYDPSVKYEIHFDKAETGQQ